MRGTRVSGSFWLIAGGLTLGSSAPSRAVLSPCVAEVQIPVSHPHGTTIRRDLAIDANGIIWFTQLELNNIGKYDPGADEFSFFDIPTPQSGPHSITVDSLGKVWFTETAGHQIGRLDPVEETFVEQATPTPNSKPYGITVDSFDDVWFTEMNAVAIGKRSATSGEIEEFFLHPVIDSVENLVIDPATGDVWVSQTEHRRLARLDAVTGDVTRFPIPFRLSTPHSVAVDRFGRVWFSDLVRNQIGRLNPRTGRFGRVFLSSRFPGSHGIIVDSRGFVWFTQLAANRVGLIVPQLANLTLEFDLPTAGSPYFIAEAPDKEIWFIDAAAPIIGRLPCTAQ